MHTNIYTKCVDVFTYFEVINSPQFSLSELNGHDCGGITQQGGSLGGRSILTILNFTRLCSTIFRSFISWAIRFIFGFSTCFWFLKKEMFFTFYVISNDNKLICRYATERVFNSNLNIVSWLQYKAHKYNSHIYRNQLFGKEYKKIVHTFFVTGELVVFEISLMCFIVASFVTGLEVSLLIVASSFSLATTITAWRKLWFPRSHCWITMLSGSSLPAKMILISRLLRFSLGARVVFICCTVHDGSRLTDTCERVFIKGTHTDTHKKKIIVNKLINKSINKWNICT